jgi:subtilisin
MRRGEESHVDIVNFLHHLHEEIELAQNYDNTHIIRFKTVQDYNTCKEHLKQLKTSLTHLSVIKELDLIHGFSCPLRSDITWLEDLDSICIEEDLKVDLSVNLQPRRSTGTPKTHSSLEHFIPWGVDHIKAPLAWSKSVGSNVRVGVIDTGIDYTHPDLGHTISRGVNLLHRGLLPYDDNGHGTHISGIIAASSSYKGIMGVAPKAFIHPVKAFDYNGSAYVSDLIAGINWCVQQDLDIINMSFGMKTYHKLLEYAVLKAYQAGKIIVASSGNDGKKASVDYPARFTQVVSVGAATKMNKIAPFSNRGQRIDVYAPGERIYSAWLHGKYNELSGTSMATAHVSGVIALMLAIRPSLKPLQIKTILKRSSTSLSRKSQVPKQPGLIHARRAVRALE